MNPSASTHISTYCTIHLQAAIFCWHLLLFSLFSHISFLSLHLLLGDEQISPRRQAAFFDTRTDLVCFITDGCFNWLSEHLHSSILYRDLMCRSFSCKIREENWRCRCTMCAFVSAVAAFRQLLPNSWPSGTTSQWNARSGRDAEEQTRSTAECFRQSTSCVVETWNWTLDLSGKKWIRSKLRGRVWEVSLLTCNKHFPRALSFQREI